MAPIDAATLSALHSAPILSGPHTLFSSTFTLTFLSPPPSLKATVLMRCSYLSTGTHLGRTHPQSPPLHLHFSQSESFLVTKGSLCTTTGYRCVDEVWTQDMGLRPKEIEPWVPHTFWPDPSAEGDCEVFLWAHPDVDSAVGGMDRLFFGNLLRYVSEGSEGKVKLDVVQVMVMQDASATAMVLFPTAWWLGPLRWWVPWVLQGAVASVGRLCGYRALMERYTDEEEWSEYLRAKRA